MDKIGDKTFRWLGTQQALWVWIAVMATTEALLCMQGLTVHDSGVYLNGYLHFAQEPMVNSYLGQWQLSYLSMGWLCSLLGIRSFLGLRMVHVALMAAVQAGIYFWATRALNAKPQWVLAGLVLAALCHVQGYSEVNYNELSALLLTGAATALTSGVRRKRPWLVAVAGALIATAVAVRVVNVWFVALPVAAWLVRDCNDGWRKTWAAWLAGGLCGAMAVLALLWASGTIGVLAITARTMTGMAAAGSGTHGVSGLAWLYAGNMWHMCASGCVFASVAAIVTAAMWATRRNSTAAAVTAAVCAGAGAIVLWKLNDGPVCNYATFLSIVTLAVTATRCHDQALRTASALWLMVMMLYPFGSAASNAVNGPYFIHLAMPLAVAGIARGIESTKSQLRTVLTRAASVVAIALALAMVKLNVTHGLFQDQKRTACRYEIHSPATRGIYTNEANARLHNWLIGELQPHLLPQQYAICNFSLPLISMLDCRPYAYAESEWVDNEAALITYVDEARKASGSLPVFIIDSRQLNKCDTAVINHCKQLSPYSTVWSNGPYSLIVPQADAAR